MIKSGVIYEKQTGEPKPSWYAKTKTNEARRRKRRMSGGGWSSYWKAQTSLLLFFGRVSKITGGKLYNEMSGSSDYLTIGGSVGSYTFQVPNTAPYISADTDFIWFKTDATPRTTTEAELIGYDLQKTPVKYEDVTDYSIEWIAILKFGQSINNNLRDSFHLSIWFDNTLSLHGNLKGNKPLSQQYAWTPESTVPVTLSDTSKTVLWLDSTDLTTMTKNNGTPDYVSEWRDKNGTAAKTGQATGSLQPYLDPVEGMYFDGDNFRSTFTWVQPCFIYLVVKQRAWNTGKGIMDSYGAYAGAIIQSNAGGAVSPNLFAYAGAISPDDAGLAVGVWGIIRVLFYGFNSSFQINANTKWAGNLGTGNMSGITLADNGGQGAYPAYCTSVNIKEVICRKVVDDAPTQQSIYDYLNTKYSLGL